MFYRKYSRFSSKRRSYRKKRSFPRSSYKKRSFPRSLMPEVKHNASPLASSFSSIGGAWVEVDLTNIAQSVTQVTRVGDHIRAKSFSLNGVLVGGQSNLATDDNRNIVRIVLAWWDSSSATPLATNGATIDSRIQSDELFGKGLLKMIYNKTVVLTSSGRDSTGYMPAQRFVKIWKKLYRYVSYSNVTGTTAGQKLILSMISDSAVVSHPGFVQGNYFFKFTDN